MRWRKLGQVFAADNHFGWMRTHAANPTVEVLTDTLIRVYFSTRDAQQRSSIGFVEIDLRRPTEVIRLSDTPVAQPNTPGHFDDSGLSVGCFVETPEGEDRLYYVGWNLGKTVPWRNSIGVLIRPPGEKDFQRYSAGPILDRSPADPYSLSYPWVMREGDQWRMWYGSNLTWGSEISDMRHAIKYAHSSDGLCWKRDGAPVVNLDTDTEVAMSRPCVLRRTTGYAIWYSLRGSDGRYRIGFARSGDGIAWERDDGNAGIAASEEGWDSEMVCYPFVFDEADQAYMLYCGNGYGAGGFGIAIAE